MDKDRSCQVSRTVLCRYRLRGKPRLSFVSDGNPLRRLLLGSNQNSLFMAVLLSNGLPVTPEGESRSYSIRALCRSPLRIEPFRAKAYSWWSLAL